MNLSRRSFLIAAPAVILTPKLLMPVKPWATETTFDATPAAVDNSFLGNQFLTNGNGDRWAWAPRLNIWVRSKPEWEIY